MRLEVDAAAISGNVERVRALAGVPVCGVVKANGYGHGALLAARAMLDGGAEWLGVADIAEALALREAGIEAPILAWLHAAEPDFAAAVDASVDVAVHNMRQLELAGAAGASVHLKLDSGLGRNGVPAAEWPAVVARAAALQSAGRIRVRGLFSHLAGSGAASDAAQLARFDAACEAAAVLAAPEPPIRHFAASAGTLGAPAARCDAVRIGIAAYGLHPDGPDGDGAAAALGLRPAMRAVARAERGVVDAGWRDGLLPAIGAPVLVGDRLARVVEIGSDALRLDAPLTGHAVLFGDPAAGEPSADAWARAAHTISYEVVTRAGAARRSERAVAARSIA